MEFRKTSSEHSQDRFRGRRPKAGLSPNDHASLSTRVGRAPRNRMANPKASFNQYITLARAAAASGDTIEAENYYQHAEHYFRNFDGN